MTAELQGLLAGAVRSDALTRAMYSTDASIYQIEPLAVVFPTGREDVARVLRYAAGRGLSVIPRGAGTGLAGEALGRGIVLDFSRHMNRVLRVDQEAGEVTVEPGVVLDVLNRQLAPLGRQIGPDPASGNRATIGGMIGNNATGAHSLRYGYISGHIRGLRVVSAEGEFAELSRPELGGARAGPAAEWSRGLADLFARYEEKLAVARPRARRNGSGYNVFAAWTDGQVNLCELLAGSEGTLAVVTEATLALVDLPPVKALLQVNFPTLAACARAVPHLLQADPAACELMDGQLLQMARQAYPSYHDVLPEGVGASLLVELDGHNEGEVADRLRQARQIAESLPGSARAGGIQEIVDPLAQGRFWRARQAATPLLFRNKSAAQPIPVIEDVAVDPEQLAQYLEGLDEITARLGVPVVYYGHAGHGALHPRPYLNLHDPAEVRKLRQLAEEVFRLAWSLGGTISSEHGEGLVRVSFIKDQYGPEVYEMFRQIKQVFDPHHRLTPGKIINDDPDVMIRDLRFAPGPQPRVTQLIFRDGQLAREIEQCNGDALCRAADAGSSMCPIFRATGEEFASPRAKANLMRHWLHGLLDEHVLETDEFKEVADLCVNCRSCGRECPALVNVPKLMTEARAAYVARHGLTGAQWLLTRSELLSRAGCLLGPLANAVAGSGWFGRVLEWGAGLDRRRPLPPFAWGAGVGRLRRYVARLAPLAEPVDRVAYFVDLFAAYNDPALARAVVQVLRHNRVEVVIPPQRSAAMPALNYGDVAYARRVAAYNVRRLAQAIRDGATVVCSEPTAALCLRQDYLDLLDGDDARLVAAQTLELTDYLARLARQGRLRTDLRRVPLRLAYHVPCHYQALEIPDGTEYLLALIDGVRLERLPRSCCGIAGTFGFQKQYFDLSLTAGEPMLGPWRRSDADAGLTECSTCRLQMEWSAGKPVLHPVKVLARAYGLAAGAEE